MKPIFALLAFVGLSFGQIPTVVLPNVFAVDSTPKVRYVYENDTVMANRIIQIRDSVNADSVKTRIRSLGSLRLTIDDDANATGTKLAITHNGTADTLFKILDDSIARFYRHLTVDSNLTVGKKISSADTIAADLGFRAGATPASNVNLYRSGANMWTTDDSMTVAGKLVVTDSIRGAFGRFTSLASTGSVYVYSLGSPGATNTEFGRLYKASSSAVILDANSTGAGIPRAIALQTGGVTKLQVTESGYVDITDSLRGASSRFTGTLAADSIISAKFYEENTFTGTLTGCTTSPTGTFRYVRIGKQVTLMIPQMVGTSNSTSATITGMPAAIRPQRAVAFVAQVMDAGGITGGTVDGFQIGTSGTITLFKGGLAAGFTNSATSKGLLGDVPNITIPVGTTYTSYSYTLQ